MSLYSLFLQAPLTDIGIDILFLKNIMQTRRRRAPVTNVGSHTARVFGVGVLVRDRAVVALVGLFYS